MKSDSDISALVGLLKSCVAVLQLTRPPSKGDPEEARLTRVTYDPDYVDIRRFDYSLTKLLERYDDRCPEHVIAAALMVPEEHVGVLYDAIVLKLRSSMGVGDGE